MQYSAEGRKTTILAQKLRHQNHILKGDVAEKNYFNLTNRNVIIIKLARAAIQTNAVRLNAIIASEVLLKWKVSL